MLSVEVYEARHSVHEVSFANATRRLGTAVGEGTGMGMGMVEADAPSSGSASYAHSANYTHFNMYKHLQGVAQIQEQSTLHRQARVDQLPAPADVADIKSRLGDASDAAYPIFREMTLASLVVHTLDGGATGTLDVWCCHTSPSSGEPPAYSWKLDETFFDTE